MQQNALIKTQQHLILPHNDHRLRQYVQRLMQNVKNRGCSEKWVGVSGEGSNIKF